jgi:cytochrome c553
MKDTPDGMEMPVLCDCGQWMELHDSWRKETPGADNVTICSDCHEAEVAEIERQEEIENLQEQISEAEWTLREARKRLIELGETP